MAFVVLIVAVATIGGFMFGYDSGVINGTQEGLEQAFNLSALGVGINVGSILVGCAVGAFLAGRLADRIGRRSVMLIAATLFIFSALGAGAAQSSVVFIMARFVGGLGVGAASVMSPAYISEVTPAQIRGRLASVQQVMIICGLTGAFVTNYALAATAGHSTGILWAGREAWRWMFWLQMIPAAIYLTALLFIPESPRYLMATGRAHQARAVLQKLFGSSSIAESKVEEIRRSLANDHQPRMADLVDPGTGRWRRIVWVGIGLAVFQQLVGINVVFYYGASLWQAVGYSEADALKINILTGSISIVACLITVVVVDRIGRRPLLTIGSAGMAVALGVMVWCFHSGSFQGGMLQLPAGVDRLALISANAFTFLFNLSWGPVMWVMLGEMFPNQIRGSGLAVAGFAQWAANFAISVSFPWLSAHVGLTLTYSLYALGAAVSFVFVRAMVHETKGRELEQMTG